jgi:predicted MFS family arabinose efflux permease
VTAGGWPSILLAYVMGVLAVMSLVLMVPLRGDFLTRGGLDAGQYGLLIGLIGIPAAALATFSGGLIDRFGPRIMMVGGTLLFALANLAYAAVSTPRLFFLFRLIEGVALSVVLAAGPTLIMRTTEGKRQVTAMTFWSTATPAAISLGVLISGSFAGTANWRTPFLIYAVALTLAGSAGLLLPKLASPEQIKTSFSDKVRALFTGYRQTDVVKLAITLFLVSATSLGLNVILPTYISQTHDVSVASASALIAGANLAMIVGAFLVGLLLTRGVAPRIMLAGLAAGAICFAAAILSPATPISAVALVFAGWSFVLGAAQAMIFAVLPRVVDPAAPGLATGVVNQIATLTAFVAPIAFLAVLNQGWQAVSVMITACWIAGLGLFWTLRQMATSGEQAAIGATP